MGTANVCLMIFDASGYSSTSTTIQFSSEAEARAFALKYQGAFRRHSVFLVLGKAELLEPPAPPAKEVP
jgi:hypothetical protein